MAPFRNILVATDFGPVSERAVSLAVELTQLFGARLNLIHAYSVIVPIYPIALDANVQGIAEAAEDAMSRVVTGIEGRCADVRGVVRHGDPSHEILEEARACGADLIVVGTHGHRGLSRVLLGSVAEKVVRLSPIPVLCVRGAAAEGAELIQGPEVEEDGVPSGAVFA